MQKRFGLRDEDTKKDFSSDLECLNANNVLKTEKFSFAFFCLNDPRSHGSVKKTKIAVCMPDKVVGVVTL